ncbi:hypothetical protein ZHAS_00008877 [Anopheles sinensis]|uniref:Lipase domain-containing protein n=1 Tax=Anopheles sinensis TaxID=74873 RepID=A0A084VTJ0_ANOSI|nr:hypothetical protein ZHAS_00008877 [Anopheles sinensis]
MDRSRKCCLIFVLCWSNCFTSGSLLKSVEHLSEAEWARIFDANAQIPLRTDGFEELVPGQNIRLYCTKPGVSHFQQVSLEDVSGVESMIDLSRPLVIATHGWTQTTNLTIYQHMAAGFRQFVPDINCCLLDWQPYAAFTYEIAARRSVPLVGEQLSKFLLLLRKRGYALPNVSLVGFSMGGQIVGLAGKACAGRIGAIFALDPAGPLFTHPFDLALGLSLGPRTSCRTEAFTHKRIVHQ